MSKSPAFLVLILLVALWAGTMSAWADTPKRVALVIGNSDYSAVPRLLNPQNDAKDIAATLRRIGFGVTEGSDLDFRGMRLAIRDFADEARKADVVLVYYAGHGIEIDNTNYLIPVNAELRHDRDVEFEAIRLDALLNAIEGSDALKIVLVDACRNNPFTVQMTRKGATRSIGRGLVRIEPSGVLVGYAAKGGTYALDGEGRNSPYAEALLQHLDEPGLELGKLFRKVRDTVFELTEGQQEPFIYGSLPGRDIFLVDPVAEPEKVAAVAPESVSAPSVDMQMIEEFTNAQTKSTVWLWRRFLEDFEDYPEHRLVTLAKRELAELELEVDLKRGFSRRDPWLTDAIGEDGRTVTLNTEQRKQVQKALNMMGFDTGGVDGQFGPKTRAAISQARLRASLYGANEVDKALLMVLPNVPNVESLMDPIAQRYKLEDLPDDLEPRLRKALNALKGQSVKFGYFRGNLYLAVHAMNWKWPTINSTARSAGGHVVTINSAEENQFLVELFSTDKRFVTEHKGSLHGPSIGLYQADRSSEPRGGWAWSNGEPLRYTRWSPSNPDNYKGNQHYARFYLKRSMRRPGAPPSYWDDAPDGTWATGFIIEIE
jgi:peptidoglycan hydrolase-like protein with peptidoglycan-binding domain